MGDPGGIGPEISIKSSEYFMKVGSHIMPIIFGSLEHVSYVSKNIVKTSTPINLIKPESSFEYFYRSGFLNVVDLSSISYKFVKLGRVNPEYARDVERFITAAVGFSLKGKIAGFATAPINKAMMIRGGARFGGHTELLGYLTSSEYFAMLFYSRKIITVLATIHIPLKAVSAEITIESLRKTISISVNSMKMDFGKNNPSIAVLGLNPHAGENGDIGIEESDTIEYVIKEFRKEGINISGPFPADSFFAKKYKMFDLIVSMYHDQALIPFKLLSFDKGVNVTLGLKIIRTSPVHGTAYDIAGKSSADCNSMIESIKLADDISRNRHKWTEKL
ncbi:4-hydroxythreonine-4-phosphate dehydrogenase PdxA [Candidatus Acidulodesulfobacterium sp. H_13]|uniref:4-hydroxythreonine-4-phosphate dehydrogenase PdxA n=1 Tax=Candidatus Acidulodesulfobacterium sp. H_13 TaxID=3395470 RepID=UPI003AF79C9E